MLLRHAYLGHYARDPQFGEALECFYDAHEEALRLAPADGRLPRGYLAGLAHVVALSVDQDTLAGYIADLDRFGERAGLDRLLPDGDAGNPEWVGSNLVHRWCVRRRAMAERGLAYGVDRLPSCVRAAWWETDLDTRVRVEGLTWNPAGPAPGADREASERRLIRSATTQIRSEMARLRREAIEAGYLFPRTAGNRERDIDWLYRRAARRERYEEIARRDHKPWDQVRVAVQRMAKRVGVSPAGWETAFDKA